MVDISDLVSQKRGYPGSELRKLLEVQGLNKDDFLKYRDFDVAPNYSLGTYVLENELLGYGKWIPIEENGSPTEQFKLVG